jgi:hypothetical protein
MAAIDIVHALLYPYGRLKLEIFGSWFALHPAKTRTYNGPRCFFYGAQIRAHTVSCGSACGTE